MIGHDNPDQVSNTAQHGRLSYSAYVSMDHCNLKQNLAWIRAPARQRWEAFYDPSWDVVAIADDDGTWAERKVIQQTR